MNTDTNTKWAHIAEQQLDSLGRLLLDTGAVTDFCDPDECGQAAIDDQEPSEIARWWLVEVTTAVEEDEPNPRSWAVAAFAAVSEHLGS